MRTRLGTRRAGESKGARRGSWRGSDDCSGGGGIGVLTGFKVPKPAGAGFAMGGRVVISLPPAGC